MYFYQYEHQYAVKFEQNIHRFYTLARFKPNDFKPVEWEQLFIATLQEWHPLMIYPELEFDLWITTFKSCYHSILLEMGLRYLEIDQQDCVQKMISMLVMKLQLLFTGVNFLEVIKANNKKHAKQVNRIIEQCNDKTQYLPRLTTVKFYAAYQSHLVPHISIFELAQHLKKFEKNLGQISLIHLGALFRYRRVLRVPESDEYICAYFFSFNQDLLAEHVVPEVLKQLVQLWQVVTQFQGMAVNYDIDQNRCGGLTSAYEMFEEMENEQHDLMSLLEHNYFDLDDDSNRLRVRPKGFKPYEIRMNSQFAI